MNNNYQPGGYPNPQNQQTPMQNYPYVQPQQPAYVPTPAPAPAPAPAPKKSKKGLIIGIIAIVAALIIGVVCWMLFGGNGEGEEKNTLDNFETGETTTIELYPDREVKGKDLEEYATVIENRAKILGSNYEISCDGEKITFVIAESMLGESSSERINTLDLLLSRGNFGIDGEYFYLYKNPDKTDIKKVEVVELDKDDVLDDYKLDFFEEDYAMLDGITADTIYGIKVSFKKSAEEKFEYVADSSFSDGKLLAFHDFLEDSGDNENTMGSVLPLEDDYSEVYIISPGAAYKKNSELMKYILEEDEMDFGLVADYVDEPVWETEGKHMGENQVASLDDFSVFVEFTPDEFSRSYNSETDFAEYEQVIKERMDVLGIDYMFGTTGLDDKTYCVRVYPEDFEPNFFRMIFGERSIEVRSSYSTVFSYSSVDKGEKDGKPALVAETSYSLEELLADNNIPGNTVYLVVNDVTIASADITTLSEDEDDYYNYLYFTDFQCFGDIEVSDEEENIFDLIKVISDSSYTAFSGEYNFRTYGDNDEIIESLGDIDWKYEPLTGRDIQVMEIVENYGYDFSKTVDKRNALTITAEFDVNHNLPKNFTDAFKKLYEECNFDDGSYNEIIFVIEDEKKETPADSFRLVVKKDSYEGRMYVNDEISGPTFYEYWSPVYNIMEEDEFFTAREY